MRLDTNINNDKNNSKKKMSSSSSSSLMLTKLNTILGNSTHLSVMGFFFFVFVPKDFNEEQTKNQTWTDIAHPYTHAQN